MFEQKVRQIVSLLPERQYTVQDGSIQSFRVQFETGTDTKMNEYVQQMAGEDIYPLIWLMPGENSGTIASNRQSRNCRFAIIKRAEQTKVPNDHIFSTEFEAVLNPLKKDLIKVIERSGISRIIGEITENAYPVYVQREGENKAVETWNVIALDFTLEIDNKACIKNTIKI